MKRECLITGTKTKNETDIVSASQQVSLVLVCACHQESCRTILVGGFPANSGLVIWSGKVGSLRLAGLLETEAGILTIWQHSGTDFGGGSGVSGKF